VLWRMMLAWRRRSEVKAVAAVSSLVSSSSSSSTQALPLPLSLPLSPSSSTQSASSARRSIVSLLTTQRARVASALSRARPGDRHGSSGVKGGGGSGGSGGSVGGSGGGGSGGCGGGSGGSGVTDSIGGIVAPSSGGEESPRPFDDDGVFVFTNPLRQHAASVRGKSAGGGDAGSPRSAASNGNDGKESQVTET
jgi:hypothetical protein